MKSKRYNDKKNITAKLIREARENMHMSRPDLSRKLELYGVYLHRNEIYKIENNLVLIKDFELATIAKILNIDLNKIKDLID